jgi:hypothetical protein
LSVQELEPSVANLKKDALLLSYEDWQLDHPKMSKIMRPVERGTRRGVPSYRLLLLRDPFNLFASLLKSQRMNEQNRQYYVRTWKQYAREYLGFTSFLGEHLVRVPYDQWRDSGEFRMELSRRIGIREDGEAYNEVPATGGGSSFDGVTKNAQAMNTGQRWQEFSNDDTYRDLFDSELRELNERIFGPAPF